MQKMLLFPQIKSLHIITRLNKFLYLPAIPERLTKLDHLLDEHEKSLKTDNTVYLFYGRKKEN